MLLRPSIVPRFFASSLLHRTRIQSSSILTTRNMSTFKQDPHKLLLIPGPIEVADEVLYANAHPSMSHVSPDFIPVFGDSLRMLREVLQTKTAQPFIISGSGTLGWDQVAANLIEPGETALVLNTGYFGDSFTDCLEHYGTTVTQLRAPLGSVVPLSTLESALTSAPKPYKVLTFTHVDTSTGVLSDAQAIAATVRRLSPSTLVVMDAVCSVASEEIAFDDWDLDVVLSASQKGLGAPPGLSVLLASERAMGVWEERVKRGVREGSYYASWSKWVPIMKAYEGGQAAYFATPAVNLVYAFNASLRLITGKEGALSGPDTFKLPTLAERFALHRTTSLKIKQAAFALGFTQLPTEMKHAANGMSALYFPPGIGAGDLLPKLGGRGVVVAGGAVGGDKYFRIGHMGVSVVDPRRNDVEVIIKALGESMAEIKEEKAKA